jgi:hypothetical protein
MAMGGSFMVPGGVSGVDRAMVPIMAAPGERVDVTPAHAMRGGGSTTHVLRGIRPKDFFTGQNLIDLIDNINKAGPDGYRIAYATR